jgi:hypothetical protein
VTPVTWHGLTADYTEAERNTMRELPRDEATVLHELKAHLDATIIDAAEAKPTHVYVWGNNPRRAQLKGRQCFVEATGRMNTVLVRFADTGERITTSRHAVRLAVERADYEPSDIPPHPRPEPPEPDQLRMDEAA